MRNRVRAPLIAALLAFGVAGSLPAQGGSRYEDRYGRQPYHERAAVLAHEIEQVAERIYWQAARNNRRPDYAEARMLSTLRELENRANRFHGAIEREPGMPRDVRFEFHLFEEAFARTARALNQVAPRGYIDSGMQRIYVLMNELERYYGRGRGYGNWNDPYRRGRHNPRYEDRWDHDGWDRRSDHDRHDRWDDDDRYGGDDNDDKPLSDGYRRH